MNEEMRKELLKKQAVDKVIEQCLSAEGLNLPEEITEEFKREVQAFLRERNMYAHKFYEALTSEYIYPSISELFDVEVGKTIYDSIAYKTNMPMLTQYSFGLEDKHNFIHGHLTEDKGRPVVEDLKDKSRYILNPQNTQRYITFNPYGDGDLNTYRKLHNGGMSNISVGVFGGIYDEDRKRKIQMLEEFKNQLTGDIKETRFNESGAYYYIVSSNRHVLTHTLTR